MIRFVPPGPRGDDAALDWFVTEFDQFLSERRVEAERLADTELFDRWSTMLRAKEDIQNLMKEPIAFSDVRVDGVRLILRAGHGFADAIIGQQRLIQLDARSFIYGEIRSEEHTSELQSLMRLSYAVF